MWARIENDAVAEITGIDPAGRFHPTLVWVACDDTVAPGDRRAEGGFVPAPSEDTHSQERAWRDNAINTTEWLVGRHRDEQDMHLTSTLHDEQFAELLQYRHALRNWPQSELFPTIDNRPLAPAWLAHLTL